jgi:hypothetical protein
MSEVSELSILEFLARTGKPGFPPSHLLHNDLRRAAPQDLLVMPGSLENKGFIKLSGPRTVDDLVRVIEENRFLPATIGVRV